MVDEAGARLAARLRLERAARGWSLAELAQRSGVSKAMISKVERGAASPTAALLAKLSGAFALTMSTLLARAEAPPGRLARRADQPVWIDPATRYRRRQVWASPELPLDLVEVTLPPGAVVPAPAAAYTFSRHLIWALEGVLDLAEGPATHRLEAGDCLALGPPADCRFENRTAEPCRYLVIVLRG